jgi:uncharacterized protein YraI
MKLKAILTAAVLLVPTAALAAPGIVTTSTGLRAGPGTGFPLVDRIPGGERVNIHGCLSGNAWCDVSWSDDRGWVSSQYLEYLYRNSYVYLPDYVDQIDVPVVPFVLSSYWSSYYSGRPWYHRRAYWTNYWTSHERFARRMTIDRNAARIGRAATRNAAIARGNAAINEGRGPRAGMADRTMRERNAAQFRGAREAQGRQMGRHEAAAQARIGHERMGRERMERQHMGRENAAIRSNARMQPAVRTHEAPRFSNARPMQHVAQPTIGRSSPVNARAQAPVPHAAPAMPRAGGGAPHINAAPRGGGPAGGGGHRGQQGH